MKIICNFTFSFSVAVWMLSRIFSFEAWPQGHLKAEAAGAVDEVDGWDQDDRVKFWKLKNFDIFKL